jgi:hypothetical protein
LATTSRRCAAAGSLNGNLLRTSDSTLFRGRKIFVNKKILSATKDIPEKPIKTTDKKGGDRRDDEAGSGNAIMIANPEAKARNNPKAKI